MDAIIVGFSRPKAWFEPFSWLIRLITWSPFSHAYIRYQNTYANRMTVFQASGLKVNFIGQTLFNSIEDIYAEFEIPISTATKLATVQLAIDKCGSPYGLGQVFGDLWVLFMRLFGKNVNNPLASETSFFCSELVAIILTEIGIVNFNAPTVTPKDIYIYLIGKGYKPLSGQ